MFQDLKFLFLTTGYTDVNKNTECTPWSTSVIQGWKQKKKGLETDKANEKLF